MKQKYSCRGALMLHPHGALRARTRAFLCALTLALQFIIPITCWGQWSHEYAGVFDYTTTPGNVTLTKLAAGKFSLESTTVTDGVTKHFYLEIYTDPSAETVPQGMYPVASTRAAGTVLASSGMSGSVITGSYGERLGGSPDPENQYITSGTLYMNVMTNDGVINWYFNGNKHNGGQITLVVSQTASGSSYCTADVRVNQAAWGTATIRTATRRIGMTNQLTATPTDGTCSFLRWEDQYGNVLSTDNPYNFQQCLGNGPYYAIFDGPAVGGGNITYHLDGGTNHGSNPASYDGSADITLQNPTKTNYTFMGWYTNSTLTTPASTPAIASGASGDYEFWAKWEINNYTVAASVSPVGAGSVSGTGSFGYGTDVTLTATPTNRRYQFVRWTESAVQKATTASYTIDDIDAAHTLVAEFEEIPVTLADNEESSYYSTTLSTFTGSMDFQMMRTFYAGM